ncbi:uncharacterized protein TM35_000043330 [Trypanosoma theileri]|uniref:Uncharacterized protein n=1 Tax=Trypanosoma theileri TaxID=67003 RepID=A0A1X0P6D1_9TRYP|nr:uncharacterized protein TM35_000043330 [Trypanosoma theileri]ORC92119.1 hypothetical protein TM35_000043330 [Trypanosoma theileri]
MLPLEAYSFFSDKDPYEQTEALWTSINQQQRECNSVSSSSPNVKPIPLEALQHWKRYFVFCRYTVSRVFDWREVFSYLDVLPERRKSSSLLRHNRDSGSIPSKKLVSSEGQKNCNFNDVAVEGVYNDGVGEKFSPRSSSRRNSVELMKQALSKGCEKRLGTFPSYLHQQRLFRWTKMLAQCITWRLSDASKKGTLIPFEELLHYRLIFVARAREVICMRFYLSPLLTLMENEENKRLTLSTVQSPVKDKKRAEEGGGKEFPTLSISENTVLTLTLTMTFASLRLSTTLPLSKYIPALTARGIEALWTDILQNTSRFLCEKDLGEKVRDQLMASLNHTNQFEPLTAALLQGENGLDSKVHSETLGPLFGDYAYRRENEHVNPLITLPNIMVSPLKTATENHLLLVTRVLETVGYVMLTKIRCFCIEKCYYVLPFIADFMTISTDLKSMRQVSASLHTTLPSTEASVSKEETKTDIIDELLNGLTESIVELYRVYVKNHLHGYAAVAANNCIKIGEGGKKITISERIFALLKNVVEPSLEVVQQVLVKVLSPEGGEKFLYFVIHMLKGILKKEMDKVEESLRSGSGTRAQCRDDRTHLMNYIDTHPVALHFRYLCM